MKRLLDVFLSAVALLAASPLLIAVAALVRTTSKGPAFHRAQRVGRNGRLFTLYKFRTMRVILPSGPAITAAGDSRITNFGSLLRRSKLDELPQLWNVIKGDMSLVGPRPEDPKYVALYSSDQRRVLAVRPGITSVASIAYRNEEQLLARHNWEEVYVSKIMPEKLRHELDYLDRASLWSDIGVICRTISAVFR